MKKRLLKLRKIKLSKRKEFVIISFLLTGGFVLNQLVNPGFHFIVLTGLTFFALLLSVFGLRENIKSRRILILMILPLSFTVSLGLFYFLLPVRWLTRIPIALIYGVGMYAILLVENIYGVASQSRSIQLLRVAHAIGFLITLISVFGLFNTVYSFHFQSYVNFFVISILLVPIYMQSLWAVELSERIGKKVWLYSIVFSVLCGQIGFILSFWPLRPILASLFLTTLVYTLIGVGQQYFANKLFPKNIIEFARVFAFVLILLLLTTRYQ